MIVSLVLFETEFLHIVSISFTALILNELIMVALEITTWYFFLLTTGVIVLIQLLQAPVYGYFRNRHAHILHHQYGIFACVFR